MLISKIKTRGIDDSAINRQDCRQTITGGKIANTTIDVTAKITGAVPIANGGSASTSASVLETALGLAQLVMYTFDSDIVVVDAH